LMQLYTHVFEELMETVGPLRDLNESVLLGLVDDLVLDGHELLCRQYVLEGEVLFLVKWQLQIEPDLLV